MKTDLHRTLVIARQALDIEIEALTRAKDLLDASFVEAVDTIMACRGRVIVMGMGKSGHVGRKIAATLASTGTPAMFVHPAEASHGDLGMLTKDDVLLALSNSGESEELTRILPFIKRSGIPVLAITGGLESTLGSQADVVVDSSVSREACPLNLAPTASTTTQLALGDALAVALLDARGFVASDFARSHPGGALGRRLLTHVRDVMRSGGDVPRVEPGAQLSVLMREMSIKGLGAAAIIDDAGRPVGIFTDGDLRRLIDQGKDVRNNIASEIMTRAPRVLAEDCLAAEAAKVMEECSISCVLIVDSAGVLTGAVSFNDLMRAKII